MRQSQLFTKICKEFPKDETSFNARILIRSGFIDKVAAGIYTFLPLGLRVHKKICALIREEMNAIGGQEILMPGLTPREGWEATGRWVSFDALFRLKGFDDKEYALGATHEEVITPLLKKHVFSYKDLPLYVYQIQTKFRNEKRAKAGLIRGREFSMKDLYSFHTNTDDLNEYYERVQKAYFTIFTRCGLKDLTYLTLASGGAFSKYSHEFQTVTDAGEDTIHICDTCRMAVNDELFKEQSVCPNCGNKQLRTATAVEVGNIFKLGIRFSQPFDLSYIDHDDAKKLVIMGCYGMGPSRLIGTIVETHHDGRGIMWPEEVAPFQVHVIRVGQNMPDLMQKADNIYTELSKHFDVLYDDRDASAGEKFADADLIGCPYRIVISPKTAMQNAIELKKRNEQKLELIPYEQVIKVLGEKIRAKTLL